MPYATAEELSEYLDVPVAGLPIEEERWRKRASELVDYLVTREPTTDDELEAAKLAVCAQVEFWIKMGEEASIVGVPKSFQIGSFQANYGDQAGDTVISDVSQRVYQYLLQAGLLYRGVGFV